MSESPSNDEMEQVGRITLQKNVPMLSVVLPAQLRREVRLEESLESGVVVAVRGMTSEQLAAALNELGYEIVEGSEGQNPFHSPGV